MLMSIDKYLAQHGHAPDHKYRNGGRIRPDQSEEPLSPFTGPLQRSQQCDQY